LRAHFAAVDGRPATGLSTVAGQPADPVTAGNRGPTGAELASLGVFLAAVVVLPLLGGIVIDNLLHRSPVFLFIGLLIGIIAGVAVVYTCLLYTSPSPRD